MALRYVFKQIFGNRFMMLHSYKRINYLKNNSRKLIYISRRYMTDDSFDNEEPTDFEEEIDDQSNKILIRNLLYADSKDPLILRLNDCASVQNVFDIIKENQQIMNTMHISQAVLVLWDLQKIFYKHNVYFETDSNSSSLLSANAILKNYINKVSSHEDFDILIKLIEANYEQFSLNALTCTLLYLNRMGVKLKTNVMQLMIMRCEKEIKNCDIDTFPLTSLSRFIVTVFSQESLYPILVSICAMPIILRRLDTCETEEDFKLLTICLHKMHQLVPKDTVAKYNSISEKLINNNVITNQNPRTIIKAIRFLNQSKLFNDNSDLTNKFVHILKNSVSQLNANELISLFKVLQIQKEPADMLEEMQEHTSKLLKNSNFETTLELLSCIVSFSSPLQRPKFEKIVREYTKNNFTADSITSLYKILYYIKSSDVKLCNNFWDKSLHFILNESSGDTLQNMLNFSFKYMHFCNNIGYRYRYYNFEKKVMEYFNSELNSNVLTLIPSKFSRISAFIIAFSEDYNYIEKLLDQLLESLHNFKPTDCLNISRGLQYLQEKSFRKNSNLITRVNLLNAALDNYAKNELDQNFSLTTFNILLKTYTLRKQNIEDNLLKKLLQSYVEDWKSLNSHIIKDSAYYLQIHNYLIPEVVNKMIEYIILKKDFVMGNTVDKVLHLCYSFGYVPQNHEEFLEVAAEIIVRDKDRFSGLAFLQSCLALCFYHKLFDSLIKKVFSVDFLEKLDEELANCYSKTTYPARVRDHLMQLNRAVCLDHPEVDVPWFHQKYIEEKTKTAPKQDFFHKELSLILKDLMKNTNYTIEENVISPYGYHLNFILNSTQHQQENSVPKTVILLLNPKAFSNFTPNLKGFYQLKQRHLEILSYNVITINYNEWKSFYTQHNCKEYVKNKIWPVCNKEVVTEINV